MSGTKLNYWIIVRKKCVLFDIEFQNVKWYEKTPLPFPSRKYMYLIVNMHCFVLVLGWKRREAISKQWCSLQAKGKLI